MQLAIQPMGERKRLGLTGFTIKVIALVLMTYDHMGFPYLGRLAAPLFLMMTVQGTMRTRDPMKYALRLYIGFVAMNIANQVINVYLLQMTGDAATPNIFETLLLSVLCVWAIKDFRTHRKRSLLLIGSVILSTVISLPFAGGLEAGWFGFAVVSIFPNLLMCDYGFSFILCGILMYLFWNNTLLYSLSYIAVSLSYPLLFPYISHQWMMVFALPIMWLYNGKKGRSMKYFFYLYYPLHIYAINIMGFF